MQAIETMIEKKLAAMRGGNNVERDPFYLIDLEKVSTRYTAWHETFGGIIQPHYAVKCNPNPVLLHLLHRLGASFDCASKEEIDRVLDLGVSPANIIFANPCKFASHIEHAKLRGVKQMTFDNEDELLKISTLFPSASMVLRIITDDSHSMCRFSTKFGATLVDARRLLERARDLGVSVVGVSFHVGSGCADASAFAKAANDALAVFRMAEELGMPRMTLLDVGGGFQGIPGAKPFLSDIAKNLLPALANFPQGTRFIAEPGRYFSAESHTLVTNIHSRRIIRDKNGVITQVLYYINEGVYHSFNCIFFDHQHPEPIVLGSAGSDKSRECYASTVFGPTCDSLDCICKDFPLPLLEVGEWLYFPNMGSYTTAAITRFNGFPGALTCFYSWGKDRFLDNVLTDIADGDFPGLPPRNVKKSPAPATSPAVPSECDQPHVNLTAAGLETPTWVPIPNQAPESPAC